MKTPDKAKEIFKPFLFPCKQNKRPDVKGSWIHTAPIKTRSIDSDLCGLDCGQAGLVVVDFNLYKKEFQESKKSQKFYEMVKKETRYFQRTQSGGEHFFFRKHPKIEVKNAPFFPCVDIRTTGGYICLYQVPFKPDNAYGSFEEFYKELPYFKWQKKERTKTVSYTHLTLPTTPYV